MKTTHIRKGNVIQTLPQPATPEKPAVEKSSETFKSINQAKRASRALQKKPRVVLRIEK
jgi:hypothetical protein